MISHNSIYYIINAIYHRDKRVIFPFEYKDKYNHFVHSVGRGEMTKKKNPKDSLWYAWYVTMHGMVNAFWLHFNKYTKMNLHKNDFFRVSTVLIQSDYVTDDKRLLSTCILNNISIAAFLTVLLGLCHFWGFISMIRTPCII